MQVFDLERVKGQRTRALAFEGSIRNSKVWQYLDETDRTIFEMVERGLSHRLIGQALGVNAGTVSRRLSVARSRLRSPLVQCALDPGSPLSKGARMAALMHVVGGQTVLQIARVQHVTPAAVAEQLTFARGVARGATSRQTA